MFYTVLIGAMPILIRLIYFFTGNGDSVLWYSITDLSFFGIMVNASIIGNVTRSMLLHRNLVSVIACINIMLIIILMSIHATGMYQSQSNIGALVICVFFVALSLFFSFIVADDEFLKDLSVCFIQGIRINYINYKTRQEILDFYATVNRGQDVTFRLVLSEVSKSNMREYLTKSGYKYKISDDKSETWEMI